MADDNAEVLALLREIRRDVAAWRAETAELLRRMPLAYPDEPLIDEARDAAQATDAKSILVRWALRDLKRRYNALNLNGLRRLMRSDA